MDYELFVRLFSLVSIKFLTSFNNFKKLIMVMEKCITNIMAIIVIMMAMKCSFKFGFPETMEIAIIITAVTLIDSNPETIRKIMIPFWLSGLHLKFAIQFNIFIGFSLIPVKIQSFSINFKK